MKPELKKLLLLNLPYLLFVYLFAKCGQAYRLGGGAGGRGNGRGCGVRSGYDSGIV